ncbi:CRISPR system precrRNA processing endoribonuclease RAMP protein Cas6 [Salipaludibacillus agaradhaerens]|uniref:CRISPR system precrRNA processing endoribonuclease RAMP protein Cas6 n=1 Tax=Salipaludibacillus agaradhaerens TaxID=76935 RepID=A0A9Q4G052_SALAG|nr:CRISPR system precrRNA processing endoribonuclease RAMP protein Cas6 [Salipaludibacillus agaradhaerens]MCR6116254.1 CRISPR system precrRNA processing endoribonuclease RAMP protein Cas6 [Salipaludibacillus agaradhaerens]
MYNSELFSLSYMPLLIRLKCCESVRLPRYLGSTLHGVMGWILSTNNETYQYIFENRKYGGGKQDIVNPYILEPPRYQEIYNEGDVLCFKFVLLGKATNYTKSVIDSLVSIPYFELGVKRKKFELVDIIQADGLKSIWQSGKFHTEPIATNMLATWEERGISRCSIHLITPLRIRRGGEQLREIDFPTIIRSITRRVEALTKRYDGYVDDDEVSYVCELSNSVKTTSSGLYWSEMSRYSNRRKRKMDFGGLLGAMTFEGDMYHFAPWLYAASCLHVGRNVTFGCGQLDVVFG